MKRGMARTLLSDFFWLGAVGSPKGDRKRRAKKNRRPEIGAGTPQMRAIQLAVNGVELMYGEVILEACAMAKKARSRYVAAGWSRRCAAGKACARSPMRSGSA